MKIAQQIANMLTEDPDIIHEIAAGDGGDIRGLGGGPRVRNVGTTALRGNVASTGGRYEKALQQQADKGVDSKKFVKEIQTAIVRGAKMLADRPDELEEFLKLVKSTVNSDLLKIAAYYRKRQGGENEEQLV